MKGECFFLGALVVPKNFQDFGLCTGLALRSRVVAPRKYPLEPLRMLRADEVDAEARALAEAARNRASAEEERSRRERDHAELVAATEAVLDGERRRLEEGELRVEDLSRAALFRMGAEQRKASSAEALSAARDAETKAREAEEARRAELARKKAEADALLRDRERWEREEERRALARDDEAAEEAFAARAHRMSRGRPA